MPQQRLTALCAISQLVSALVSVVLDECAKIIGCNEFTQPNPGIEAMAPPPLSRQHRSRGLPRPQRIARKYRKYQTDIEHTPSIP
jgi:hypothetical protein